MDERVGRAARSFLHIGRVLMANGKGGRAGGTAAAVEALVTPVVEELGLRVWDVRFEKEGPDWFLRIYIDRDEPLDMNTCEAATRAIDPVLDAADPIQQSYFLEVGSPGLGRKLTRDAHFETVRGRKVSAHLIRPDETGARDVSGTLLGKEGADVLLEHEDGTRFSVNEKDASYFKLCDDEDLF